MKLPAKLTAVFTVLYIAATLFAMAPQICSAQNPSAPADNAATPDNVFTVADVPQNQRVPLIRATFDSTGYQLYDTVGETILVPFANNNLYVLKFAQSDDDEMYFVNDGGTPELFVPDGGYLTNAEVPSAKWYPFSDDFSTSAPVYLGAAQDLDSYEDMDWYPDMDTFGGYYCVYPSSPDATSTQCPGFGISIGTSFFYEWTTYNAWRRVHPPGRVFSERHDLSWRRQSGSPFSGKRPRENRGGTFRGTGGARINFSGGAGVPEQYANGGRQSYTDRNTFYTALPRAFASSPRTYGSIGRSTFRDEFAGGFRAFGGAGNFSGRESYGGDGYRSGGFSGGVFGGFRAGGFATGVRSGGGFRSGGFSGGGFRSGGFGGGGFRAGGGGGGGFRSGGFSGGGFRAGGGGGGRRR